jgi:hypothetical protein
VLKKGLVKVLIELILAGVWVGDVEELELAGMELEEAEDTKLSLLGTELVRVIEKEVKHNKGSFGRVFFEFKKTEEENERHLKELEKSQKENEMKEKELEAERKQVEVERKRVEELTKENEELKRKATPSTSSLEVCSVACFLFSL